MAIKALSNPQAPNVSAFIDIKNSHPLLRYCQNVQLSYNQADNFGLSLDDAGELKKGVRVSLRSLYVAPHLAKRHYLPEQIISAETDNKEPPDWQRITDIIAQHPRSFVLGDPGTGKTTLIHSLMLAFTNSGSNLTKITLGELVPIALILRELPLGGINSFADLWHTHCQQNPALMQPFIDQPTLIDSLLHSGQALILLDGLDEITHPATRRTLGQVVLQAMHDYPACRFVISSRIVGFDQAQWLGLNDDTDTSELALNLHHEKPELLPVAYLAPFSYPQAQQFISHWYQNYQPTLDSNHAQRVSELLMRIKKNDGLGRLSRIPVLLNMMCFIHARRGRLPDGRAELYQRIAETYLVSLDAARGINSTRFDYRDCSEWLSEIALTMQKKRGEEDTALLIPEQQVRDILTVKLTELGIPDAQIQDEISFLLRHFAERSGLFLPRGEGLYGFSHLSFLEYFAAKALKLHAELGELEWRRYVPKTGMIWWQETFVLFFEQVDHAKLVAKYIQNLFVEGVNPEITDEQITAQLLLAAIVMDSGVKLIPTERKKLIEGLWRFYLRIPFQINPYNRPALFNRLWQPDYEAMSVGLDALTMVTELNLSYTEFTDVSVLAYLVQLKRLNLRGTDISDVTALASVAQLESLEIGKTAVSDVSALAALAQLQILELSRTAVSDITALSGLAQLQTLLLRETAVSDVSALAGLAQLQYLDLSWTTIRDVSALSGLAQLQHLDLSWTAVSDVSALVGLAKLQSLNLSGTAASDVSALAGLAKLQSLDLSGTAVSDVYALAGLTKLQSLDLSGIAVSDVSALKGLTQLQWLNLSGTAVSDVTALSGLTQLHIIS